MTKRPTENSHSAPLFLAAGLALASAGICTTQIPEILRETGYTQKKVVATLAPQEFQFDAVVAPQPKTSKTPAKVVVAPPTVPAVPLAITPKPIEITKENMPALLSHPTHAIARQICDALGTMNANEAEENFGISQHDYYALVMGSEISERRYYEREADFTAFTEGLSLNLRANPREPLSPLFLAATGRTRQEIQDEVRTALAAWPDAPLAYVLEEYLKN